MSSLTSSANSLPPSPSPVRRPLAAQTNTRQLISSSKVEIEAIKAAERVRRDPRAPPFPRRRGPALPAHAPTEVAEYAFDDDARLTKFEQPSRLGLAIEDSDADLPSDGDNTDSLVRITSTYARSSSESGAGKNHRGQNFENRKNSGSGLGLGLGLEGGDEWAEQSLKDEREAIRKVYPKSPSKAYRKVVEMEEKMGAEGLDLFLDGDLLGKRKINKGGNPISNIQAMREPVTGLGLIVDYSARIREEKKSVVSLSGFVSQQPKQDELMKQFLEDNRRANREAAAGAPSRYRMRRGSNVPDFEKADMLTESVNSLFSRPRDPTHCSSKYSSVPSTPDLLAPGIQDDDWMTTCPPCVSPPPTPRPDNRCRQLSQSAPRGERPPLPLASPPRRRLPRKPLPKLPQKRPFDIWLDNQERQAAIRLHRAKIPFDYANYQAEQSARIRDVGQHALPALPTDEEENELGAIDFSTPNWQFGDAAEFRIRCLLRDIEDTTPKGSIEQSRGHPRIGDIQYPSGILQPILLPTAHLPPKGKIAIDLFDRPQTAIRSPVVNKKLDFGGAKTLGLEDVEICKASPSFRRGRLSEDLFEPPGGKDLWGY